MSFLIFFTINQYFSQGGNVDFNIWVGCCYANQSSEEFEQFSDYLVAGNYEKIRERLNSAKLFDQLLSVICIDELASKNKIELSEVDKIEIAKIKSSKKKYYLCMGCTGHYREEIQTIFVTDPESKNYTGHLKILKTELGFKN